jgi:hypothetical protein
MFKGAKEPRHRGFQNEISKLGSTLAAAAAAGEEGELTSQLDAVESAIDELRRSASGSWLGYHAYVYYAGFAPAPPGANFSQEWGLKDLSYTSLGSVGDWRQFDPQDIRDYIFEAAGFSDLKAAELKASKAMKTFDAARSELSSIFEVMPKSVKDGYLTSLFEELQNLKAPRQGDFVRAWQPRGQLMTRDMVAMGQGFKTPPHLAVLDDVLAIRSAFVGCVKASEICQKMSSHMRRKGDVADEVVAERIFIGHGRSLAWRELKDFLQDRLHLEWNEFNRLSAAGCRLRSDWASYWTTRDLRFWS